MDCQSHRLATDSSTSQRDSPDFVSLFACPSWSVSYRAVQLQRERRGVRVEQLLPVDVVRPLFDADFAETREYHMLAMDAVGPLSSSSYQGLRVF